MTAPAGPIHVIFGKALADRGILRQTLIWVKQNATFAPMGTSYHWRHEPMYYGWLPNAGHRWFGGRKQDTVWEVDRPMKSPDHPTMKPVALIARALENSSKAGETVLDMFIGSGSTIIAADTLGRRCFGLELDPKYVDVAVRRWEAFTGLRAERVPVTAGSAVAVR